MILRTLRHLLSHKLWFCYSVYVVYEKEKLKDWCFVIRFGFVIQFMCRCLFLSICNGIKYIKLVPLSICRNKKLPFLI